MYRLNEYIKFIQEKKAVLFVGAGLSQIAGCSGWGEVCKEFLTLKEVRDRISEDDFKKMNYPEFLEYCRRILKNEEGRIKFNQIIRNALIPDPKKFSNEYIPCEYRYFATPSIVDPRPCLCQRVRG